MAFANSSISDLMATTIENRGPSVADNVTKNNGVLAALKKNGRIKTFSGGTKILQPLSFAQNGNGGFYSGYDLLPVQQSDVISASQWDIKQYAVPVVVSGLELLQNSGKEGLIDLLESRMEVAEATMANDLSQGIYSDGTTNGGKGITGLDAIVEATATASQTSTVGGISRTTWTFWRCQTTTAQDISTAAKIQTVMNKQWASQNRGGDRPDLIVMDSVYWGDFLASLQNIQRFVDVDTAKLGFPTIKYMTADVVLDGGIGGYATVNTAYFLNTKYLFWRPHSDRNMVPLSPNKRYAINQDAEIQILGFAGNLACSGAQFQGRSIATSV